MDSKTALQAWLSASALDDRIDHATYYNEWVSKGGHECDVLLGKLDNLLGKSNNSVRGTVLNATIGYLIVALHNTSLKPIRSFRDEIISFI